MTRVTHTYTHAGKYSTHTSEKFVEAAQDKHTHTHTNTAFFFLLNCSFSSGFTWRKHLEQIFFLFRDILQFFFIDFGLMVVGSF